MAFENGVVPGDWRFGIFPLTKVKGGELNVRIIEALAC